MKYSIFRFIYRFICHFGLGSSNIKKNFIWLLKQVFASQLGQNFICYFQLKYWYNFINFFKFAILFELFLKPFKNLLSKYYTISLFNLNQPKKTLRKDFLVSKAPKFFLYIFSSYLSLKAIKLLTFSLSWKFDFTELAGLQEVLAVIWGG